MINCILVADKEVCTQLSEYIGKISSLNLIGSFCDSASAGEYIKSNRDIGLAFIDIESLDVDCFEFIVGLDYQPNIIILSADDQFAIKAFDLNVVDYLLKPVNYSRFFKAVDKANKFYSPRKNVSNGDNEIFIKKGSALVRLKLKNIIYIEALENYVVLHTNEGKYTIHFTLRGIENQIPDAIFCRIHRSYIVNKSMISTISENSLDISISGRVQNLPIGKSFKDSLLGDIKLITR